MTFLQTPALILRTTARGEADLIVTLFTRDRGKLRALAKSALKSLQRFPGQLELFNHLEVWLRSSRIPDLPLLHESRLLEDFPQLRPRLEKVAAASLLAEVAETASGELDPDPAVYRLLLSVFRRLDREKKPEPILWASLLRLLARLGFAPALETCALCQRPLSERGLFFHAGAGGALCPGCGKSTPEAARLSPSTIRSLRSALRLPPSRLTRLGFTRSVLQEVGALLPAYAEYHLGRELKAGRFWRELFGPGPPPQSGASSHASAHGRS